MLLSKLKFIVARLFPFFAVSTPTMGVVKVWLREPHHTDDEAVKLVVDETSDVSDVLLKVPEFLRVRNLKPSEIQAEYQDAVLSNRFLLYNVFQGKNEGTLVIRPRPMALQTSGKGLPFTARCKNRVNDITPSLHHTVCPLPSPKVIKFGEKAAPPVKSLRRSVSYSGVQNRSSMARRGSRDHVDHCVGPHSAPGSRDGTPKKQVREHSHRNNPVESASSALAARTSCQQRVPFDAVNSAVSRFRQEAEKMKATPKRNNIGVVCGSFRPQWGRPLCATCGRSKHLHWAAPVNKTHKRSSATERSDKHPAVCASTAGTQGDSVFLGLDGAGRNPRSSQWYIKCGEAPSNNGAIDGII